MSPPRPVQIFRLLLILLIVFLAAFTIPQIHRIVLTPQAVSFDTHIEQAIHAHSTPTLTLLARALSLLGSPEVFTAPLILVAAILWSRSLRREGALLLLTVAASGALESAIKLHYRRSRPSLVWAYVHERTFSFPSGHSVFAVVLPGIITYLVIQRLPYSALRVALPAACITWAAAIGLSRVYLGAHHPTDVLTGYFLGAACLFSFIVLDQIRNGFPPDRPENDTGSAGPCR